MTAREVLVVVVAGPGPGRSVALRFAREGAAVGLVARSTESAEALAAELRAAGSPEVAVAAGDVGDEAALRAALGDLHERLGPATATVYNGSAFVQGSGLTLAPADLRLAVDVGVTGAMVTAQEVAPAMRAAGRGTLLLTGSVAADRASTSATAVGVAKAALRNLALSLNKELQADGVRVTTVTIDGLLQGPKALDLDDVADLYWRLHTQPDPPPAVVVHPG
jgi:NAD(P)-dependent dehydrogenase (short-subunit alcohol dehydrogenase family)